MWTRRRLEAHLYRVKYKLVLMMHNCQPPSESSSVLGGCCIPISCCCCCCCCCCWAHVQLLCNHIINWLKSKCCQCTISVLVWVFNHAQRSRRLKSKRKRRHQRHDSPMPLQPASQRLRDTRLRQVDTCTALKMTLFHLSYPALTFLTVQTVQTIFNLWSLK